jgi:hypothetical protein
MMLRIGKMLISSMKSGGREKNYGENYLVRMIKVKKKIRVEKSQNLKMKKNILFLI